MTTSNKYYVAAIPLAIGLIFSLALRKPANSPKIERSAIDTFYYLQGRRGDFEALAFALANPDDITKNQAAALRTWVLGARQILPLPDSLKKK